MLSRWATCAQIAIHVMYMCRKARATCDSKGMRDDRYSPWSGRLCDICESERELRLSGSDLCVVFIDRGEVRTGSMRLVGAGAAHGLKPAN